MDEHPFLIAGGGIGGMAAALALLQQGDHVLCFAETYGPTRSLITRTLGRCSQRWVIREPKVSAQPEQRDVRIHRSQIIARSARSWCLQILRSINICESGAEWI